MGTVFIFLALVTLLAVTIAMYKYYEGRARKINDLRLSHVKEQGKLKGRTASLKRDMEQLKAQIHDLEVQVEVEGES